MHILEHLFLVGEFPARAHLLSGLTLEQVTLCPDGASHSIYEALWHVVAYQQSVIAPGDPAGDFYPSAAPEHEHQWHDLVRVFLDGARAAAGMGQAPERLALEVEPGVTLADELNSVAVHNTYHLGKIVALRQRIGANSINLVLHMRNANEGKETTRDEALYWLADNFGAGRATAAYMVEREEA